MPKQRPKVEKRVAASCVKVNQTGGLMCRKCGRRSDEPVRHVAIMNIECDGTEWVPYEPSPWEVPRA